MKLPVTWASLLRESVVLRGTLVLVLLAVAVTAEQHGDHGDKRSGEPEDHEEEYEALETRLNKVTARLQHIDDELDARLDPKLKIKALSLEHHIDELEEDHCDEHHYNCGGSDEECVSKLFVCDGTKDCRNGDDEKHCELPTKAGDHFEGSVVYDKCTQRKPEHLSFTITAVKTTAAYTAFPIIRATIEIHKETDNEDVDLILPTVGYYKFATHNLILLPPEDDGLGLICDFDGHDFEKCTGDIVNIGSLEPCARFIFVRKHDHDEHE